MDLRSYISAAERKYRFRIKTVVDLDDTTMERIEKTLIKYMPSDISSVKKTLFQSQPLDFVSVKNAEVFMVDIELLLPASAYVLQQELRMALGIPESFLVVRSENDQGELETLKLNALHEIGDEAGDMPRDALLNVEDYAEFDEKPGADYYGNLHNSRLLAALKKVEDTRNSEKVDPKNPIFSWLQMPKSEEAADFNADLKDAPKVGGADDGKKKVNDIAPAGNVDDANQTFKRVFVDKTGNRHVLTRKISSLRKDR